MSVSEVDWLKAEIGDVLHEGLVVTAFVQPEDPVDFLGKWLQRQVIIQRCRLAISEQAKFLVGERQQYLQELQEQQQKETEQRVADSEERRRQFEEAALLRKQQAEEKKRQRQIAAAWERLDSLTAKIEADEQLPSVSAEFDGNEAVQKITREVFAVLGVPLDNTLQLAPEPLVASLKSFKTSHVQDHRLLLSADVASQAGPIFVDLYEWVKVAAHITHLE